MATVTLPAMMPVTTSGEALVFSTPTVPEKLAVRSRVTESSVPSAGSNRLNGSGAANEVPTSSNVTPSLCTIVPAKAGGPVNAAMAAHAMI